MDLRIYGTHFVWNNGDTEPRRDGLTDLGIDGDTEHGMTEIRNQGWRGSKN